MFNLRQKFGQFGESLAARYLKKQGYKILCLNYRTRFGEIDLIAKDNDTIVFVEVKSRSTLAYGGPKYAITPEKRKKISINALHYLKSTHQMTAKARFDVVTIYSTPRKTDVEVIKNAFEVSYP